MDGIIETSVLIDLLRNFLPALSWQQKNQHLKLAITPIIWMEIVQGEIDKKAQTRAIKMMRQFQMIDMVTVDVSWAMQQLLMYHLSHNVGMADCLIAAPAQRLQMPLYTRNIKHFSPLLNALVQKPY